MMEQGNSYRLKRPCADCPFRSDRPFYLRPGRVESIRNTTQIFPFTCHKTVDYDEEPTYGGPEHCAGALILREKLGTQSLVMRMAQEFGVYDPAQLDMSAPVYDSWEAMIVGCSKGRE